MSQRIGGLVYVVALLRDREIEGKELQFDLTGSFVSVVVLHCWALGILRQRMRSLHGVWSLYPHV